ncbi:hypothetical protein SpiGrapes_1884 [Sphaerochaeta pleomorpha str. Grapes]|uniref:Uncharacterized protein n=1 Tax=Sphaerochaeta pleomorpha (strain ATCC BAA-1885 / DSM 22778 / Grapes) TaxID=158190 RepID=G8QYQ1_SPHPG|nr:hypothetical protein [Sphaerochaeta pleomorpha]AEV29678.1 hypothetical protein SpiGrapes_1884 [Sphaerochaeta pleomorpha str. Grapes]
MADKKTSSVLLRIVIALLYISMGLQGLVNGGSSEAIGSLFNAFDSDAMVYILSTVVLLGGILLFVPLFAKGLSPVFVKGGMIAILVIWVAIVFFADFAPGFRGYDAKSWISWIEMFMYHLIVLFATYEVCKKALA